MTQMDGEKELVLGNASSSLVFFFVVVALCGVFFAMGYMIGRNTSKSATANLENTAPTPSAQPAPQSPESQSNTSEPPRETVPDETPTAKAQPRRPRLAARAFNPNTNRSRHSRGP